MSVKYKNFNIKNDGTFSMKTIVTVGPGSVPKSLKGSFTSVGQAQKAIDSFLLSVPDKKANKNVKENITSRS